MSRHDEYEDQPYLVIEERDGIGIGPFLVGLTLGAGLALLYAPRTGEETRRELRRQAIRARRRARDAADDLGETVSDRYEQAKRSVEDRLDQARRAIEVRKHQASEAVRAGREAAQQARRDLEARIAENKATYRESPDATRDRRRTTATAGDDVQDADDREPDAE